ncbi:MarR family winged helix-turn-helix transcriptional regulator [Rhizobium sp. S152]|uniref:MarR family winged helix-turn-helix transcriptional regulator n=1 Tax=Rhizobium sp. S152 TaxID=3055038 RepID=UPI0025A9F2AA|nr:MarR family winged helix-turn-helix transcriptional regulator [Rhizobium sp. S152]MDM9628523.1 MarR family winged helix-turn-helix transcriptional regulator [Rhizobium sp. S152]
MDSYIKEEDDLSLGTYLCHCLVTRQMARFVTKIYQKHLGPAGLTAADVAIFDFLSRNENMTMTSLADAMLMERTTLLRAIKPLQDNGFIETTKDPASRRQLFLALTAAGKEKKVEAEALWALAQADYEAEVGRKRARQIRSELLETMGEVKAD